MMSGGGDRRAGEEDGNPVVEASGTSSAPALPFDIVVVSDGGARRELSPKEFFALPLAVRIQHVVEQRASFYARGVQVDAKAALAQIRKLRANLH